MRGETEASDGGDVEGKRGDYAERWAHLQYSYLIYLEHDFIVFLDKDDGLDWETSPEYDTRGSQRQPQAQRYSQ